MELPDVLVSLKVVEVHRSIERASEVHAHLLANVNEANHCLMIADVLPDLPVRLMAKVMLRRRSSAAYVTPHNDVSILDTTDNSSLISCCDNSCNSALVHVES